MKASILTTIFFIALFLNHSLCQSLQFSIPISATNRSSVEFISLTRIGAFGLIRKARPGVPQHLHTGIDIKRPVDNYYDEPVFPIAPGVVISMREDGPFAQIIVEHSPQHEERFWTIYEHVSGIRVSVADSVSPAEPIARFMNRDELDCYGWQFDHLHFEILKVAPRPLPPSPKTPTRFYGVYNLECYTESDLNRHYLNPLEFLENHLYAQTE